MDHKRINELTEKIANCEKRLREIGIRRTRLENDAMYAKKLIKSFKKQLEDELSK